ncbi:hypothetical protein AAHE18_13G208500 [Arachis hypogaea]
MGLLSFVVPVYVAEVTPKNLRGGFTTVHQLMICCGVSLTYLIGAFLNWRILALIGIIPCSAQVLSLPFIPESPRQRLVTWRGAKILYSALGERMPMFLKRPLKLEYITSVCSFEC